MGIISKSSKTVFVFIGIDIGQAQDSTAVIVSDPELRNGEVCYPIRFLRKFPLGMSYPDTVASIKRIYDNIQFPEGSETDLKITRHVWLEVNGVGAPVCDMIREAIPNLNLHSVYVTGGEAKEKVDPWQKQITMPKAFLVSRLQVLIGFNRIDLPDSPEAREMQSELRNHQIKVNENANAEFGAFKVGTHDDLVTALGLACLAERSKEPMAFPISRKSLEPGYYQESELERAMKYYK